MKEAGLVAAIREANGAAGGGTKALAVRAGQDEADEARSVFGAERPLSGDEDGACGAAVVGGESVRRVVLAGGAALVSAHGAPGAFVGVVVWGESFVCVASEEAVAGRSVGCVQELGDPWGVWSAAAIACVPAVESGLVGGADAFGVEVLVVAEDAGQLAHGGVVVAERRGEGGGRSQRAAELGGQDGKRRASPGSDLTDGVSNLREILVQVGAAELHGRGTRRRESRPGRLEELGRHRDLAIGGGDEAGRGRRRGSGRFSFGGVGAGGREWCYDRRRDNARSEDGRGFRVAWTTASGGGDGLERTLDCSQSAHPLFN